MRMNKPKSLVIVFLCVVKLIVIENALASISRYIQPPFYDDHSRYPVAKQFGNRIHPHATATTNSNKIFIGTHVYQTSSPASVSKQPEPQHITSTLTSLQPPPPLSSQLRSRTLYRKLHKFLPEKTTQFIYSSNYNYQTPAPFTTPINQEYFNNDDRKETKPVEKWYPEEDAINPDIYYKAEPFNHKIKHNIDIVIPSPPSRPNIEYLPPLLSSSKRPNTQYLQPPENIEYLPPSSSELPNIEYLPAKDYWDENGTSYPGFVQSIDLNVLNNSFKRAPSPGDQFELDLKRSDSRKPYNNQHRYHAAVAAAAAADDDDVEY